MLREIERMIRKALKPHLREKREDAADLDLYGIALVLDNLRVRIQKMIRREALRIADRAVQEINEENAAIVEQVIGVKPNTLSPAILQTLREARKRNVDLITSIPQDLLASVQRVLTIAHSQGTRVEVLAKRIERRFEVTRSRARLIARDQTMKINAQLTQKRQKDVGVRQYVWSTSRDERVRDMHAELEGKVFSWDDPPVTNEQGDRNHPGEDYQCRCVAIPVLDLK